MANHLVGSFQLMKSLNKTLILNVIRTDGPISRAEIDEKNESHASDGDEHRQ